MNTVLGIALLGVGALLVVLGINASQSAASDVSRFFSGSPTNQSIWLLVLGILSVGLGLFFTLKGSRNR
jgi:LPXTG-motif cell wall-anchored protein